MSDRPEIKVKEWMRVGNRDCVVVKVRSPGHDFGDCEVVFDPSKPTNADVVWDGDEWRFVESGDYGGYADRSSRLTDYVHILKSGRSRQ